MNYYGSKFVGGDSAATQTVTWNTAAFIRYIKFLDSSLFNMIKDFIPVRTSTATGVIIKPTIKERQRQRMQATGEEAVYQELLDKGYILDEEGLRAWFGNSKSKDGKKGWVNVVTGDSCASDKPGEGVPKCVSSAKRASMSKKERLASAAKKRREDPNQQSKKGAAEPTMVKTDVKEETVDEACWKGYEKKGMKKMFGKMYPNCVKKTKSEEVELEGDFIEEGDEMKGLTVKGGHKRSVESGAGLTQKGVDAVNRKTGGNLKTAVTTPPSKLKPGGS